MRLPRRLRCVACLTCRAAVVFARRHWQWQRWWRWRQRSRWWDCHQRYAVCSLGLDVDRVLSCIAEVIQQSEAKRQKDRIKIDAEKTAKPDALYKLPMTPSDSAKGVKHRSPEKASAATASASASAASGAGSSSAFGSSSNTSAGAGAGSAAGAAPAPHVRVPDPAYVNLAALGLRCLWCCSLACVALTAISVSSVYIVGERIRQVQCGRARVASSLYPLCIQASSEESDRLAIEDRVGLPPALLSRGLAVLSRGLAVLDADNVRHKYLWRRPPRSRSSSFPVRASSAGLTPIVRSLCSRLHAANDADAWRAHAATNSQALCRWHA